MARAVVYYDGKLEVVTKPVPEPEPGHVVVHMKLRPVNPVDMWWAPMKAEAVGGPAVPGEEGYGIVHSIGQGVTTVTIGQRVVPFMWHLAKGEGSWQEYVSIPENQVWPVSSSISDEAAAQFVANPWAAHGFFVDLKVPKGEYVLQFAAGSVLGRLVIQLAKHLGIKTINVVRRSSQKAELKAIGADEVISSNDEDVVARVKEITNNNLAYGALDPIGGENTKIACSCVRSWGQVFVFGFMAGTYDATAGLSDLFRGVSVTGWTMVHFRDDAKWRKECIEEISMLMEQKIMLPMEGQKFDLADVQEAVKRSEESARGGKVLLTS